MPRRSPQQNGNVAQAVFNPLGQMVETVTAAAPQGPTVRVTRGKETTLEPVGRTGALRDRGTAASASPR